MTASKRISRRTRTVKDKVSKRKVMTAVLIVAILLIAGLAYIVTKMPPAPLPKATLNDLLASTSERTGLNGTLIVPDDSPYPSLMATSAAVHYEEDGTMEIFPLLVASEDPDTPALRFTNAYDGPIIYIGYDGALQTPDVRIDGGSLKTLSLEVARNFWTHSDGAMLIDPDDRYYGMAINALPLASYVDIPVIITSSVDTKVASLLKDLGVKYTIVIGEQYGYEKVMRFKGPNDYEGCRDIMTRFITDPEGLNTNVDYLTMANPMDSFAPQVLDTTDYYFDGEIYHHASMADDAWPGTTNVEEGMDFEVEVPEDYEYALMHLSLRFKAHEQADLNGARIYVFIFDGDETDEDGNPAQETFFGTPAGRIEGEYRVVDFTLPVFNDTGIHSLHVQGKEVYDGVPNPIVKDPAYFELTVSIERISSPVFPYVSDVSAMAPYLTAYHHGLILANEGFALQYGSYLGCVDCGEPTTDEHAIETANNKSLEVHHEVLKVLAHLEGEDISTFTDDDINEMATRYYDDPVYINIMADTNMVPHYYYPGGHVSEGYGEPGDTIYGDINADPEDPTKDLGPGKVDPAYPDIELPVGRLIGYDTEDVSVIVARSVFYYDIIDSFRGYDQPGFETWKNNGYAFLGSAIPVETMYPTLTTVTSDLLSEGGFQVQTTSEVFSHREASHQYQEGSNFILGGVHGFYYWYVPSARTKYSGGSAYDVAHTRDMAFGPSVMFLVSCVTGRVDGLDPENSLALAYQHAGTNVYIGATRSTVGWLTQGSDEDLRLDAEGAVLLAEYYTEGLMADKDVGLALRDAKNGFLVEDSTGGDVDAVWAFIVYAHYILHGDVAFNPYEPANGG